MTKQLTDSEYQTLKESWLDYASKTEFSKPSREASFSAGFVYGLSYNQVKLDKLAWMLIAAGVSEGIVKGVLQETEISND